MSLFQFGSLAAAMAVALSAVMAGAWMIQRRTGMTGWIDVCWTFGVGLVAAIGSLVPLADLSMTVCSRIRCVSSFFALMMKNVASFW